MRISLGNSIRGNGSSYNIREDEHFKHFKRIIYLNRISSVSLNTLDVIATSFWNVIGKTLFGINDENNKDEWTVVTVQNQSIVEGNIHDKSSNNIKQSVYFHHGIIRESLDNLSPNSVVEFSDINYVYMKDNNSHMTKNRDINIVSSSTQSLLDSSFIPDPLHYDEIDQIRSGVGSETNYIDDLSNSVHEMLSNNGIPQQNSFFKTTLSSLIDSNTVILRRNITIEDIDAYNDAMVGYGCLSAFDTTNLIVGYVSEVLRYMEFNGFSSCHVVLGGPHLGFNVDKVMMQFNAEKSFYNAKIIEFMREIGDINMSLVNTKIRIHIIVSDLSNVHVSFVNIGDKNLSISDVPERTGVMRTSVNNYINMI